MTDEEAMEELLNSDGYSFPTWTLTLGLPTYEMRDGELVKRVEKKANYISKECPQFDTLFGKDTQSWSNGGVDSQLLVIVPWDESRETFESVAKWLDSIVYEI